MANKQLITIPLNSDALMVAMRTKKVSIRKLAKKLEYISERTLRTYIEEERCPPYILGKIAYILSIAPSSLIKGRTIWMRLGVTVPVTDEELYRLIEPFGSQNPIGDRDLTEEESLEFLKRAVADDDSYIPGYCIRQCILNGGKMKTKGENKNG